MITITDGEDGASFGDDGVGLEVGSFGVMSEPSPVPELMPAPSLVPEPSLGP